MGDQFYHQRVARHGPRYRKLQSRLYNFLERPSGRVALIYHILVFCFVLLCLGLSVISTIEDMGDDAGDILVYLEIVIVLWFGLELALRLWSSGCRSRYQGLLGRMKFIKSPFCVIDIVTICASMIVLSGKYGDQMYAASALRGLRFFQILRMVRMDRRGGTWKLLGSVVYAHRQELITTLYIGFLVLIFSSFIMFLVEKDEKDINGEKQFASFAHALWWGFITLCTVGYGDAVPQTWKGKIIACFCALFGISFFALPAGILGSGFALKVQQQQRQKHMIRRRGPAATLIQSLWRCYASNEGHHSEATWKIHLQPASRSPTSVKNPSLLTRMSTIRRTRRADSRSPARQKTRLANANQSADNLSMMEEVLINSQRNSEASIFLKRNSDVNFLEPEEDSTSITSLTKRHKGAIRAIRKLKYLVAKRKFKEALKPYDIKDVIESYSAGHTDLVFKVKGIQTRLDQILGVQGSKAKDVYDSKTSLASKIVNIERQVDTIDEKLQLFIEMYQKDRKRFSGTIVSQVSRVDGDEANRPSNQDLLISGKDPGLESLADAITEILSPESEVNLPSNLLSSSSTITSMSHGVESPKTGNDVSIGKPSSVFSDSNAFNV
jgi:potassium voltage-gated channel KQT-like subfamily protein